ncbi:hypothetical protein DFH06DRAFT_677087 [Mycena polygramma]|nr:hypothetical protein DFH06DRAFT_677087 [Mycena polygramma]
MAEQTNPFAAFADLTLSYLENTLGVFYIGYVFAAVGYGFTFFQSYFYYTRFPKDRWFIQATVSSLCILDTAMSALSSHTLYYYLVSLFALPVGPDNATTSFCVEILLSGIAVALVQSFYAVRIWQVSQNSVLAIAIIFISIAGAGLGIATAAVILRNTLFANFSEHYMKAVISTGQGLRLLSALMGAGGILFYGAKQTASGQPSTVDPITTFLTSGTAGAVAQLICWATFLALPKKYVWIVFHFVSSRVFINGLLLMLNSRAVSRGRGIYEEETRFTNRGVTPSSQTKTSASDIMFTSTQSNNTRTVNIEVSRVVNSDLDLDPGKHFDDLDSRSALGTDIDKVDVHAY